MSIATLFNHGSLLAGAAAVSLVALGTAAQADYRGYRGDGWRERGYAERHYAPRYRHYHDDADRRRRERDKRVARGIAIGVGAVILGTILAAEANRRNRYDYHD